MGIKDLWSILTPFCDRRPLFELQGKTVAVDLSCWICEAQNVSDYSVQPRMYLRTCFLLLMDVHPVFVLEGKAPTLKYQTIANRNEIQFKGCKPKTEKTKTGKDRSRFHFVLKTCEEMLKYMGLICIQGSGEAESMCAYLNQDGLVSGCISQDSDCFAYGAKTVYRNFSISHQGSYAATGGSVDIYDIEKANEHLNFGRNKIIALALLLGSDYNEGVKGVGKDSALKFFNNYKDQEILDRMRSWKSNNSMFLDLENKINDKNICSSCGHKGKVQSHSKNGCDLCKTTKGCDFSKFRDERLDIKNEIQIRNKAILDPVFPNETLIKEYLIKKDNVQHLDLKWKQPDLVKFVKFTVKYLGWEEIYAFEKLLPILTRWLLKNYKKGEEIPGIIYPKFIKKCRNPKGIPSYEIIWEDKNKYFELLIPEIQIQEYLETKKNDLESLWSTIEPKHLVDIAYPDLVNEFMDKKGKKGQKTRKRPKKPDNNIDDLTSQLLNTSLGSPEPKKTKGRPKKVKENVQKQTIDVFFSKTKVNQLKDSSLNLSFDLNCSKFYDDDDSDSNLSDIVDQITKTKPELPEKLKKLGLVFKSETIELNKTIDRDETVENRSCFFETNYDQVDLFEKTFDKPPESDESGDEFDEFQENYIPLLDRIKNTINT